MRNASTRPQPRKGLYFALEPGELRHIVRECQLVDFYGHSIAIRHENLEPSESQRVPLFQYLPGTALVVFSVPSSLPAGLVAPATRAAARALVTVRTLPKVPFNLNARVVAFLIPSRRHVVLVRRLTKFQRGTYRSGSKFSTAFKPRVTSVTDTPLATIPIIEEAGAV